MPGNKPKMVVLVHGLFSSASRTSLRNLEAQYKKNGYRVVYVDYNSITENPSDEIRKILKENPNYDIQVVGHSLGGKYVSEVSMDYKDREGMSFVTINSPFSSGTDNARDVKNWSDWSNVIQLITNPFGLFTAVYNENSTGHAVDPSDWKRLNG